MASLPSKKRRRSQKMTVPRAKLWHQASTHSRWMEHIDIRSSLDEITVHFVGDDAGTGKGVTKLGLRAKKDDDFGEWYAQVVVESEMISYYDISGTFYTVPPQLPTTATKSTPRPFFSRLSQQQKRQSLQGATFFAPGHSPFGMKSKTGWTTRSNLSESKTPTSPSSSPKTA